VEGEGEEDHVNPCKQRRLREEGACQKGEHQRDLEKRGEPAKKQRKREADRSDIAGRIGHSQEFEDCRHGEGAGENQPGKQDGCVSTHLFLHWVLALMTNGNAPFRHGFPKYFRASATMAGSDMSSGFRRARFRPIWCGLQALPGRDNE